MTTKIKEAEPKTPTLSPFCVNLVADLFSILGDAGGTGYLANSNEAGFLRITLCGFGPVVPYFFGTGMLADAGVPQMIGPQVGSTPLSVILALNTSISPGGTFYEIAVLDANKNVIQCGNYQFNTTGVVNLMDATQILPPYSFSLGALRYLPCTGSGSNYSAPGKSVVAVSYNGLFMEQGASLPQLSYTVVGTAITLNFTTQSGDRIDALVVT